MDLMSCPAPIMVWDSCLDTWSRIGSGGFGQIYKARHKKLCCDVAIKLLHRDDGSGKPLLRELDMMRQGSSPYVIQVLGVFRGQSPFGPAARLGLVMEFMERGCLAKLQVQLCGAPPWPLVFRLAHQVALGINFLHSLSRPLLHLDLKPSNVLLDCYINAKLTDFGLARVYHSVSDVSKRDSENKEGTLSYMPPEALDDLSYIPTKASDIYSFGILLWSIVAGKEPYPHAMSSMIRLRIPQGDRPSLKQIQLQAAEIPGLSRLQELMEQCWTTESSERPSSHSCTLVTEELYSSHKHNINAAVLHVLQKLDQTPAEKATNWMENTQTVTSVKSYLDAPTGKGPIQEAGPSLGQEPSKSRAQSVNLSVPVSDTDLEASPSSPKLKRSSVKPIQASPSASSSSSSSSSKNSTAARSLKPAPSLNKPQLCQRHLSNPDSSPRHRPALLPNVTITCSNVSGLQVGNNNRMNITHERRRHPTAPSRVDLQPQTKGSGKKGGDG